ncbi:kinesin-like protein KIN-14Q [Anguilla anguilla]|uniref:kinesin-like protein KIN-14Q n=1 Tax=Anguilla anguilla TaxID=7936 RepID=UPI0015AF23C1|nr:kinesin-like protein KIN-14Q [Anguilla anguilla]
MQLMRNRHLEMVQELEENFQMASQQNQEKTVQKIRMHYQNKLNTLKRVLDTYQERVEEKNVYMEERLKTLKDQNQKHIEEKINLLDQIKAEATHWDREKNKMLDLFSSKLDLLHSHQASTLQELQITRLELGKVQEMLKPAEAEEQPPLVESSGTGLDNTAENPIKVRKSRGWLLLEGGLLSEPEGYWVESWLYPIYVTSGAERAAQTQGGAGGKLPLEGAKARLEVLKESLYKREREITQLLQGDTDSSGLEGEPNQPPTTRLGCSALLNALVHKAHCVYVEVAEAKLLVDSMVEENQLALERAREFLERPQTTPPEHGSAEEGTPTVERCRGDENQEHQADLQTSQMTLQKVEIIQTALECIRKGTRPGLDSAWEICHSCAEPGPEPDQDNLQGLDGAVRHSEYFTAERVKSVGQQLLQVQAELQQVRDENKRIIENYNSERIMRKKYYNMVEDMKGKIRVFCRIRPMSRMETAGGSKAAVDCVDEYSVVVETPRGWKEFQFDRVFGTASSQEEVFQDTSRLIQSAMDGFNVCIFAYGQTGSGKTFTMVGDKDLRSPGIMPRTFRKIFDLIQENAAKFDFKVSAYMLELYNDRLLDLLVSPAEAFGRKIEIKKDKKGLVFPQGAETTAVGSAEELFALFQQGCANRHIAATKMNVESSRSHLIIGITVESTNLTNGSVSYGKLSLVDLAGSERAAKTGAKDDQLKEANSINKSLSALGDVIFALSSEQPHVPYRNNKLTQVMQDSLGGNAKTLMFVNVSPSDCNAEETLTSLTYATRVKAITNSAQKNLESKEITHLKEIILKLKSGQPLEEEV